MLAPGSLSTSIRLVAGADLAAADQRATKSVSALAGSGNLTLNDPNYNSSKNGTFFDVLRTGTGNLDLLAGGSFSEATPYGVYTAGTQSAPILVDGSNPYDLLTGTSNGNSSAWYPEHGGDVVLSAQLDVGGNIQTYNGSPRYVDSDLIGNWLQRQGGGVSTDPAAWWINFGSFGEASSNASGSSLLGFQGIGTLGGGNLTVIAGRNAGVTSNTGDNSTGLDLAVASTGRVLADGTVVETGGGDLTVKVGGAINQVLPTSSPVSPGYYGAITDLRGDITVTAGSIGTIIQNPGAPNFKSLDPRTTDPDDIKFFLQTPGPVFTPGDGTVSIDTRGDLVFGGAGDAGMVRPANLGGIPYHLQNVDGSTTFVTSGGQSSFTLWTPDTAIDLYAAGGDVAPLISGDKTGSSSGQQNGSGVYPGTLIVAAANGDIRFGQPKTTGGIGVTLELMPSPTGQLELLADGSIYGSTQIVAMSGADPSLLATPSRPVFSTQVGNSLTSNASVSSPYYYSQNPIAFGPDTPTTYLHASDSQPALVYAGVDIEDLTLGQVVNSLSPELLSTPFGFVMNPTTWYRVAKPFEVIAGRDIVGTGLEPSAFMNTNANQISLLQTGRDIIYQSVTIAGQGGLQVQAGRNLYQGYYGSLTSVGDVVNPANTTGGAGITVLAGVGANGPDYTDFAKLYFNAANQLPGDGTPLAGSGKVAHSYDQELLVWLKQRFGYAGSSADALAYFLSLPVEQQGVFVRQVYYEELAAGGREYNDPSSSRYQSYLRGREAIATLFPDQDANGKPISYSGQLTMFSSITGSKTVNGVTVPVITDAGIHTQFGGDIQILNPGGQTIIGVEGIAPGAGAGLITQGQGDIDIYSLGSILLGQSRIMTTFGGDILAWSAEGDINAGRGSKTTTIYAPPKRAYDLYGRVTLAPTVPSAGAGIATLQPIPGVPPGDVDLIAPLGTIDAGEAGIRVSGNVNLAALQVVNAANIQVQGTSTGIPTVQGPPVAALTSASNTAAATQQTVAPAQNTSTQASVMIVEIIGYGGGAGDDSQPQDDKRQHRSETDYDPNSAVHMLGNGILSDEQRKVLTEDEKNRLDALASQ